MVATWGGAVCAEKVVYDSEGRRDPFVKVSTEAAAIGGVRGRLQGIIYDPQKQSFAIFGGRTYKVGEGVGNLIIKKIQKDRVVVLVNGEEKVLRIREEEKNRSL